MIKNINYIDRDILADEEKMIFGAGWVFICLDLQLSNNNDFVTYNVNDKKLVIQNFGGKINCFENVCLHRFNKIQDGISGNSPFFCKYHSWAYDANGNVMVGDAMIKEELQKNNRTCLTKYEVEKCGRFYFVKINPNCSDSLRDYLEGFYEKLEEISENMSAASAPMRVLKHQANWKLLVENVLECYHCSSVHKETLVPMGIGRSMPENHCSFKIHDSIDYPMKIGKKQLERSERLRFLDSRTYKHTSLRHFYIFPNLFVTSTDGILFYVGRMDPISPNETNLCATFVKPQIESLSIKDSFLLDAFLEASIDSALTVINEDKTILENIQSNLNCKSDLTQIFGGEEFRIKKFHAEIEQLINYK